MEANFSAEETARTRSAAKPLTFLPERRMLFIGLAVNSRKEVLYDATRILGDLDPRNITGDASRWRALNQSWMPLGCGHDFISIVFETS